MKAKILILGLIYLLMVGSVLSTEKENLIGEYWQKLFTEPVETIYFIMEDGVGFRHSNQDERIIYIDVEELKKSLKTLERTYEIKDISIVIHNHRIERKFSISDKRFYGNLKKYGFNGQFLIYCHRTKEVYNIKGKEKSK